jgi:hypothetical protein
MYAITWLPGSSLVETEGGQAGGRQDVSDERRQRLLNAQASAQHMNERLGRLHAAYLQRCRVAATHPVPLDCHLPLPPPSLGGGAVERAAGGAAPPAALRSFNERLNVRDPAGLLAAFDGKVGGLPWG